MWLNSGWLWSSKISNVCFVSSGWLREWTPSTTFLPFGLWKKKKQQRTIRNIIASKTRKQNHTLITFLQNCIHDDQKVASPCWQTVHCSHHPLICNHKPSTLVFHVLAFWQLDGGHVGPRVWRCLSATDYTLTWVWAEEEYTILTFLAVCSCTHKVQIQGNAIIQ